MRQMPSDSCILNRRTAARPATQLRLTPSTGLRQHLVDCDLHDDDDAHHPTFALFRRLVRTVAQTASRRQRGGVYILQTRQTQLNSIPKRIQATTSIRKLFALTLKVSNSITSLVSPMRLQIGSATVPSATQRDGRGCLMDRPSRAWTRRVWHVFRIAAYCRRQRRVDPWIRGSVSLDLDMDVADSLGLVWTVAVPWEWESFNFS